MDIHSFDLADELGRGLGSVHIIERESEPEGEEQECDICGHVGICSLFSIGDVIRCQPHTVEDFLERLAPSLHKPFFLRWISDDTAFERICARRDYPKEKDLVLEIAGWFWLREVRVHPGNTEEIIWLFLMRSSKSMREEILEDEDLGDCILNIAHRNLFPDAPVEEYYE